MQEGHGFREMRRRISRCASAVHDGGGERLRGLSVGASELLRREYVFFFTLINRQNLGMWSRKVYIYNENG